MSTGTRPCSATPLHTAWVQPLWEANTAPGEDVKANGIDDNAVLPSIYVLVPIGSRMRPAGGGGLRDNVIFIEGRGRARLAAVLLYARSGTVGADIREAIRAGTKVIIVAQSGDAGCVESCRGALRQLTTMGALDTGPARGVKVLLELDQGVTNAQRVSDQLTQLLAIVPGGGATERVGIMANHERGSALPMELGQQHPLCLVHPHPPVNRDGERLAITQMQGLLGCQPVACPWQERGVDMWVVDEPITIEPVEGEAKLVVVADRLHG